MRKKFKANIGGCITAILVILALIFVGFSPAAFAQHTGHGGAPAQAQETVEEEEEAPEVEIPQEKQQLIGVKTVAAAYTFLRRTVRTVGRIEYDERKYATVNTKFAGWIEKLHVDTTGQRVRQGDRLAEVYSPEILSTQQEFLNLLAWARRSGEVKDETVGSMLARDAESIIEAARQRLRLWDITEEQIREIEQTGKTVRTLTLYSPVDGYVIQKAALQGMRVMPGQKLFDVADLSTVWVIADIYEYELPLIKEGDTARISLSYFPGREFIAKVEYIYPNLASETRTAKVRFSIPNPEGRLKPKMFTNVEVKVGIGRRLAIPESAVIDTGVRQIVYVDKGEGYFEPRQITVGIRADGTVEVLKGLKAGERVASAGNFLIDSEAKLKGVVK